MATKHELELREILVGTGLIQPLQVTQTKGSLSALCRFPVRERESQWLERVTSLLVAAQEDPTLSFHFGLRFVLKDGRLVKGHWVGIEARGQELDRHLQWLREQLEGSQQLEEAVAPAPERPPAASKPAEPRPLAEAARAARAELRKHTDATPRPSQALPGQPLETPSAPAALVVVESGRATTPKGRLMNTRVEEFPLPHVTTTDMNRPNEKGRGATTIAED